MTAGLSATADTPRGADHSERFVAFAFAGSDMVVEVESNGVITFAAGAFRSRYSVEPEAFIGRPLGDLFAPVDGDAVREALSMLCERGRLLPMMVRLADPQRTRLALAGLVVPSSGRSPRYCLTLAREPAPLGRACRFGTPCGLARASEALQGSGSEGRIGLLEILGTEAQSDKSRDAIGRVLESMAPDAYARQLAPGRFGLVGAEQNETDLSSIAKVLEAILLRQGMHVSVNTHSLAAEGSGLTAPQAARALRHALNVFASEGTRGVAKAGYSGGLAGYLDQASLQVTSLRQAIRDRQFGLQYQPIVSLLDRTVHHYEALIRPDHAFDQISNDPQSFVSLAEALGLAEELDLAIAPLACEAASRANVGVAFNVSGQSFQDPAFRERFIDLLRVSPACTAGLVTVEMTETAEIQHVEEASRTATALREIGVRFCLDDFGAGAADVRLLRALTPDIIKLDGSYVSGVEQGGRERAIVAGIFEIARAAGAEIVAERVETESEAEALRSLGAQYGQGWLLGRPAALPGLTAASLQVPKTLASTLRRPAA